MSKKQTVYKVEFEALNGVSVFWDDEMGHYTVESGIKKPFNLEEVFPMTRYKEQHDWKDIGYTAVFKSGDYHCDVKVYRILAWDMEGAFYYESNSEGETDDIDKAVPAIDVFIKWDGCSSWSQTKYGALHFCGYSHAENYQTMMERVYNLAHAFIENADISMWGLEY